MCTGIHTQQSSYTRHWQCYYLKGAAVCLEQALINFGMQFLMSHKYVPLSPPTFMRKEVMNEVSS